MNYYQFHIGDFRSGTFNMSRLARWIYRDMLDVYYDTESRLPLDLNLLCDTLGIEADDERRIVERILRLKFEATEDGYRHLVCDRVIDEYRARAEVAKANGKLGGRPKGTSKVAKKPAGFSVGSQQVAIGGPPAPQSQANQEPYNQEPKEVKPPVEPSGPTDLFDADMDDGQGDDAPAPTVADEVCAVWDHWRKVMASPRSTLDAKRRGAIEKQLKAFTPAELCRAIDGCRLTPHNMGQNDRQTKFNDIELICRNAANVERFMDAAANPPRQTTGRPSTNDFGHDADNDPFDQLRQSYEPSIPADA